MTLDLRTIIAMLVISAVLMTLLLAFGLRAGRAAKKSDFPLAPNP